MRVLLALSLLLPMTAMANHPQPPEPPGLMGLFSDDCNDPKSGQPGICTYFVDATGQNYLVFTQNGEVMLILKANVGGTPEVVWQSEKLNSI